MAVDNEKIRISPEEEQAIKDQDPTTIPLDPTAAGWSGEQVRARQAASITAEEGSVLSELKEKTDLIADKFVEVDAAMNTRDNQVSTNVTNIQTNANDIDALETGKLNRDGSQPMLGDLDMDDHQILNANIEATNILVNDVNIQNIIDDVDGLKNGTVLAHSAKNTNDGLGNANTAQAIKQTVDHVNQDVKDTASPTFVEVNLGEKTLTETKIGNLETAFGHTSLTNNPHSVTKEQLNLGNVNNTSDLNKPISTAVQTALDNKVDLIDGKVDPNQLPSYVDDIVEFNTLQDLENATKEVSKIYVVTDDPIPANNTSYRITSTGTLVKFDHTSAEWGHITGTITNQTDIEDATFTSTVTQGNINGITLKTSINDLDDALKTTNSNVSTNTNNITTNTNNIGTNTSNIQTNANNIISNANAIASNLSSIQTNANNIGTNATNIANIVNGTTDIDFDNRQTNLTSTNVEDVIHEIYGQKGANNGIATLDQNGRLPASQLTLTAIEFKGTFGSTASTTNGDLPSNPIKGDLYVADENNYTSIEAGLTFNSGDKAIFDGTNWVKNDAQDEVISVNNKTGAVTIAGVDIGVDTANFNKHLVNTDNTVQKALDRLDDHTHTEQDITDLDKYTQSEVNSFLADKLDVGALASSLILYPTTAASDIASYNRLVSDPSNLNYNITAANVETPNINGQGILSGQLIADANLFVGNPGIINVPIVGQIRKTSNNPNANAVFYFEIHKRDAQGNEVLLATSDVTKTVTNTTYQEFNASALLNNGIFLDTDRVVLKFYGNSVGNEGATYEFQFGGATPVRALFNIPISATLQANRIAYDNTNSTLDATNLQGAMDELDVKLESNITTIRVEQFRIVNPDLGNGTFSYLDSNLDTQTGTIDGNGFYIFDLQISGYYTNSNLVEANVNDDFHYFTTDGSQLREGDGDSEGIATSVKINHNFVANDEIDIKYYQGLNIAASALSDGAVSFGKLNIELQGDITDVRESSPLNGNETIVRRNALNEFQGILDGKFKTPRTIALAGDVTGQAQFDGSSGITIQTVVAKQNFDGGNALSVFTPDEIIIEGGGA
jgi:hypothetical protein